jgi:hypothetical protein
MSQDERIKALMAAFHKTTYFKWMASQNIPVIDGYGLEDVRDVAMAPWARTGGKASFINLYGMEGVTGMYVGEIPAGGALEAEKHFYEEVICILDGQGATEVWQEGGRKQMFEWGSMELVRAATQYLASTDQRRAPAGEVFGCDQRAAGDGYRAQRGIHF